MTLQAKHILLLLKLLISRELRSEVLPYSLTVTSVSNTLYSPFLPLTFVQDD